jgi:hypothetical protein
LLIGCGGGHAHKDVVLVNDASDEVYESLTDLEADGLITMNATEAAALSTPSAGSALPAATIPTFTWALPTASAPTPRHGMTNGNFFWLHFSGAGITGDQLDVLAANTMTWTPADHDWEALAAATGTITVRLVTAVYDDAIVAEGPWRGADVTYTIQR